VGGHQLHRRQELYDQTVAVIDQITV
jgi:hypothetical protein